MSELAPGNGDVERTSSELDAIAFRTLVLHEAERRSARFGRPRCLHCGERWFCRSAAWAKGWQAARAIGRSAFAWSRSWRPTVGPR